MNSALLKALIAAQAAQGDMKPLGVQPDNDLNKFTYTFRGSKFILFVLAIRGFNLITIPETPALMLTESNQ